MTTASRSRCCSGTDTRWLAGRIPSAFTEIRASSARFGVVEIPPDVLSWPVRPT